jgi:hypothetical protein
LPIQDGQCKAEFFVDVLDATKQEKRVGFVSCLNHVHSVAWMFRAIKGDLDYCWLRNMYCFWGISSVYEHLQIQSSEIIVNKMCLSYPD